MTSRPTCDFGDFDRDAHGCLPVRALIAVADECDVGPNCFSVTSSDRRQQRKRKENTVNETVEPLPLVETPLPHAQTSQVPQASEVPDVMALVPKDGSAGAGTVAIALIAVVGSGAAMKLWQTISKNKHEERMKELDRRNDDHPTCKAERAALEARVSDLAAKVDETTKAKPSMPELPDFDEIEERLSKIEKATAAAKKQPAKSSTK